MKGGGGGLDLETSPFSRGKFPRSAGLVSHILSRQFVIADSLSRSKPLSAEWQIDPRFREDFYLLPTLSIEFFAICRNAQLQGYLSPFPVLSAKGINALSHTWDFSGCCTFPLYPAAFSSSREDSSDFAPGSVTGPTCNRQPWYSSLVELSVAHAVRLPLAPCLWSCRWHTQYISRSNNTLSCRGFFSHPSSKCLSGTLGRCLGRV